MIPHCNLDHTECGYVASGDSLGDQANSKGISRIFNLVFLTPATVFLIEKQNQTHAQKEKCTNKIMLHQFI